MSYDDRMGKEELRSGQLGALGAMTLVGVLAFAGMSAKFNAAAEGLNSPAAVEMRVKASKFWLNEGFEVTGLKGEKHEKNGSTVAFNLLKQESNESYVGVVRCAPDKCAIVKIKPL